MGRLKKGLIILIAIILSGLSVLYSGCSGKGTSPEIDISEAERIIRIDSEGDVLHYRETVLWDEEKFSEILEDKSEFFDESKNEFEETFDADSGNFDMEFTEDENSTILSCDVYGKFNGGRYDFLWFLNPPGLDFLDSPFRKSGRELSWGGALDGRPTYIVLEFTFSFDNCHAHVWEE
ncbi:MAG: hypothetical protein U9O59_07950 [Actinomycetota bacterium]|nr:hypothetical protein [Actinomycetota bacterium]